MTDATMYRGRIFSFTASIPDTPCTCTHATGEDPTCACHCCSAWRAFDGFIRAFRRGDLNRDGTFHIFTTGEIRWEDDPRWQVCQCEHKAGTDPFCECGRCVDVSRSAAERSSLARLDTEMVLRAWRSRDYSELLRWHFAERAAEARGDHEGIEKARLSGDCTELYSWVLKGRDCK